MNLPDLKEQLKKCDSVREIHRIALQCLASGDAFDQLVDLMTDENRQLSGMAAWAMGHAVQQDPSIVAVRHHRIFVGLASMPANSALKRNITRAWQWTVLPEILIPEIADITLGFLKDQKEDTAVRAFSITVLESILKRMPELREEIVFAIERNMSDARPSFMVRANRLLRIAQKMHEH